MSHSAENRLTAPNTILLHCEKHTPTWYIRVKTLLGSRTLYIILIHEGLHPLGCVARLYTTESIYFEKSLWSKNFFEMVAKCQSLSKSAQNTLFHILIHWTKLYPILIHWAELYPILIHWTELYPILIHWTLS